MNLEGTLPYPCAVDDFVAAKSTQVQ